MVIFEGNSFWNRELYLLYDADSRHYVITNLKSAMAEKYKCNACDTLYDRACSLWTGTSPCFKDLSQYCATCNRWFLSEKCFQNRLTFKVKGKVVSQWRKVCRNCKFTETAYSKNECFKIFCNKNQPSGHFPSIRSAHRNSKSMMDPLSIFPNTYVLSRCVQSVKR